MGIESLERKLFVLRHIDGSQNNKAINRIREIEARFSSNPEFVGLGLRGSTVRGYSTKSSDVDLVILWDSSKSVNPSLSSRNFQNAADEIYLDSTIEPRANFITKNIDPSVISWGPMKLPDERFLCEIFRLVTGKKIDEYRQYWIEVLQKVPKKVKERIIAGTAVQLAGDDLLGWEKMAERVSGIQRPSLPSSSKEAWLWTYKVENFGGVPNRKTFYKKRLKLWNKRFNRFFEGQDSSVSKESVVKKVFDGVRIFH